MNRRALVLASLLIATLSVSLVAQQPPPGGPRPGGPNGPGGPGGPPPPPPGSSDRGLVQFLALTDAQKATWQSLHEAFRTATQPLIEQRRQFEKTVHDLLEGSNPDALKVGEALVAADRISDQLKAAHEDLEDDLEATLTPDQKLRLAAWKAAIGAIGGGPGRP